MFRLTAERPIPLAERGASTSPQSTATEDEGAAHCNTNATASRPFSRTVRDILAAAAFPLVISALVVICGIIADHTPPELFVAGLLAVLIFGVLYLAREGGRR
jgi:hypothetical protein